MDEDFLNMEELLDSEAKKGEEEEEINKDVDLDKIIEENDKNKVNDKEYISKFIKDNLSSAKNLKVDNNIEGPDLVEQLLENKDQIIPSKNTNEQNKNKIDICPNSKKIKLPNNFETNPNPLDFIDFMERKYNKCILEQERDKYFYLEKYQKEGKYKDIKCWKFEQKNSIMNHILKNDKNNYIPKQKKGKTKITCLVANENKIYIGDDNGKITIFSIDSEIEKGPLNQSSNNLKGKEKENVSVTSMDLLLAKNLLVCGYYNGVVEVWDLENEKCKKTLLPEVTKHKSQILAVKFLNGNAKMIEIISSDCSGLVNISTLTKKFMNFYNQELNAEINPLIEYIQPIFVVEMLKFSEQEKKMPFLKKNIEIVGFACYDYVFIYQINPDLIELFKFQRPTYFSDFYIPNISFGFGYIPRTKDIIDINKDQNQKLNEKASEYCIDVKNLSRLIAVSWEKFINIYAIKFDLQNGVEKVAIVGNYINSSQINRMFFVGESAIFIYDEKDKFKLLNTGMMTPGEILLDNNGFPLYEKDKEERALIQQLKNIVNKVLKQDYLPSAKKNENENIKKASYYNSIYTNNNNIFILGENELEYGEIYSWEKSIDKLKSDSEWIDALIFGLKVFRGEYLSYIKVPIDEKKRKESVREKMKKIIKEYVNFRTKYDKNKTNETKYNEKLIACVYLSIEFCFEIESIDFLFNEIEPIYVKKNLEKFFYESLEPYIINGNIGKQLFSEKTLTKLVQIFSEKKQFQKLGQIIKNLYLSIADSEIIGSRTTKYDTIFTGLITYCSAEKNKDYMLPAREIYSYLQSAKQIPRELFWKIKKIDEREYYYFDYENVVNNTDIDELILSYQYLGSLLLWYINLCFEGYKFPSNKIIEDKKHVALIQQLFLWLINDEVLQRLIEFDSYTLFNIFKKFFMQKLNIIEKIEYSDLFKLIKIGDKELQEAKIEKYIEIIIRKASRIDNIYVNDDLYNFICSIATKIKIKIRDKNETQNNNFLLQAIYYIINYKENLKNEEKMEKEIIDQKGDFYVKNTEIKEKYDRFCLHLNRYKDRKYILNISNIVMAAIENNIELFSQKDLEDLLQNIEKTELIKLKIYLGKKTENYAKCLDVCINEHKEDERIFALEDLIYIQLSDLKNDQKKYAKFKNDILSRVTEIASLSIDKLIKLTNNLFEKNHSLILFKINDKSSKLKYLEEILFLYKEDEISPNDPIPKEYIEILKMHIDLLCQLKYFNQILPNLKRRYFYPVDYCLQKCTEYRILDACIYLERKNGNINQALKLAISFTKEEFNKLKLFLNENYEEILKLEQEQKKKGKKNNEEDDDNLYFYESDFDLDNENENEEKDILEKKRKIYIKQEQILKIGIEICESGSETLSKIEAKENWSSLIKLYYELINEIKTNLIQKEINLKLGENLIKKLEGNIDDIIEKMNLYFDLDSIMELLSNIQGKSFGLKEFKSHLNKLLFSGMSYNSILKSAESILREDVQNSDKFFRAMLLKGKQYFLEICDLCGGIFRENDRNSIVFFKCGHKYHYECTIFVNEKITCKFCRDKEYLTEDTIIREEEIIKKPVKKIIEGRNRIIEINNSSSSSSIIKERTEREKMKKLKYLNEVNNRYFENFKLFE